MFDIGYYIYHNCKHKDCPNFPVYTPEIGRYHQNINDYPKVNCELCEGCKTYEEAKRKSKEF